MAHGITENDIVLSTRGGEWHNLATLTDEINDETAKPLLFPIEECALSATSSKETRVAFEHKKALIGNLGAVRPELVGTDREFIAIHVPSKVYPVIPNADVWREMKRALDGIGAKVTCIGTLENARKFFISVALAEDGGAFTVNVQGREPEQYKANLNFVTSHDGTLGVKAYDSTVRIVCMNTLQASLGTKGDLQYNIYHTTGAKEAMANLGNLVNASLSGRERFRNELEYLGAQACTTEDAWAILFGYFATTTKKLVLSTKATNAIDEIARLYTPRGLGNKGESLYDLLNGATEYWTIGDGTGKGKGVTAKQKAYLAEFGEASKHKVAMHNLLLNPESVAKLKETGQRAMVETDNAAKESAE